MKLQDMKMQDMRLQEMKLPDMTNIVTGREHNKRPSDPRYSRIRI